MKKLVYCLIVLCSCTSGKTLVDTVGYYAITSGDNTNYYRVRIESNSKLSKLNYKSGWYPTRAIDRLFGNVTSDEAVKTLEVQEILRAQYDKKIVELNQKWLDAAGNPQTPLDTLLALMDARKRILAYPSSSEPFPNSFEIEYNPEKGLAILHSDEKFVVVVSSDPNEVVGKISAFAESDQTALQIKSISNVIRGQNENEVKALDAKYRINKLNDSTVLAGQIERLHGLAQDEDQDTDRIIKEINAVIGLLNNSRE